MGCLCRSETAQSKEPPKQSMIATQGDYATVAVIRKDLQNVSQNREDSATQGDHATVAGSRNGLRNTKPSPVGEGGSRRLTDEVLSIIAPQAPRHVSHYSPPSRSCCVSQISSYTSSTTSWSPFPHWGRHKLRRRHLNYSLFIIHYSLKKADLMRSALKDTTQRYKSLTGFAIYAIACDISSMRYAFATGKSV